MLKILFIFLFLFGGGLIFYWHSQSEPPLQGLVTLESGEQLLVSRARPVVLLSAAAQFSLKECGYRMVRPEDRRLSTEGCRVSFALYQGDRGQLVLALAQTPRDWEWEPAAHVPFKTLWRHEEPYAKEQIYESLFLLAAKDNPFGETNQQMLAYRGKFLLSFRKMQVLMEYHEPIEAAKARTIELNEAYQRQFLERARAAYRAQFPTKEAVKDLADRLEKLLASETVSRQKLARWVGEIRHPGEGR